MEYFPRIEVCVIFELFNNQKMTEKTDMDFQEDNKAIKVIKMSSEPIKNSISLLYISYFKNLKCM